MTFRELYKFLSALSEEELDLDATIYLTVKDEYLPCGGVGRCTDGILDDQHPYIEACQLPRGRAPRLVHCASKQNCVSNK